MNVTEPVIKTLDGVPRPAGWALMGPTSRWQWVRDTFGVDALQAVALLQSAGEWEVEETGRFGGSETRRRGSHAGVPKRWSPERMAAKRERPLWYQRD